jgi:hypothetical protein
MLARNLRRGSSSKSFRYHEITQFVSESRIETSSPPGPFRMS